MRVFSTRRVHDASDELLPIDIYFEMLFFQLFKKYKRTIMTLRFGSLVNFCWSARGNHDLSNFVLHDL